MSEVYRVTAVLSDLKVMCMWKKQIERSQMKQWTIDGFVKSQIFKLYFKRWRILGDSGSVKVMVGLF